jgi:hypothetical protein
MTVCRSWVQQSCDTCLLGGDKAPHPRLPRAPARHSTCAPTIRGWLRTGVCFVMDEVTRVALVEPVR